jgi:hypothetical protein
MANEYTFGQKLQGIGAALSGTIPQFQQEMQQLSEARTKAMYQDAGAAYQMLQGNNYQGIIDLANDRLSILRRLPGSDPSDTQLVLQLAQNAMAGDTNSRMQLQQILEGAYQRGIDLGYTQSTISQMPATFQSRHMMALAAGFPEGSSEYKDFMARGSVDEFTPGITRYRNGVAVQYSRGGRMRVTDQQGNVVTGQAAQDAIQSGIDSGVLEAGATAQATAEGTSRAGFATATIQEGLDAAKGIPYLNRTLDLLNQVETGGFNSLALGVKRFFGLENADEAELDNILSQNVLSQLKQVFGAQFTEREGALLAEIEANFGKSTEGNKRLINQLLRRARFYSDAAIDRAEARGDFETAREIERFMNLNLSMGGDTGAGDIPRNADGIFMPTTEEHFNAMPAGATFIDPDDGSLNIKD